MFMGVKNGHYKWIQYAIKSREREGQMGCFFTLVPKVLHFLIYWLNIFGNFYWILIGWFIKLSGQMFWTLILIYRRGNFVYYHWGWTSIYRPLSYPFRSQALKIISHVKKKIFEKIWIIPHFYDVTWLFFETPVFIFRFQDYSPYIS